MIPGVLLVNLAQWVLVQAMLVNWSKTEGMCKNEHCKLLTKQYFTECKAQISNHCNTMPEMTHLLPAEYSADVFYKIVCGNTARGVIESVRSHLAEYSATIQTGLWLQLLTAACTCVQCHRPDNQVEFVQQWHLQLCTSYLQHSMPPRRKASPVEASRRCRTVKQ